MLIRHATPDDAARIAEIHVKSWQASYRGIIPDTYLNSLEGNQRQTLWSKFASKPEASILLATDSKAIIGFCHMGIARDTDVLQAAEIMAIYIDPNHERKGAGNALITHAISQARQSGFKKIILWVLEANHPAKQFYHAMNFTPDGTYRSITIAGSTLTEIRFHQIIQTSDPTV